MKEMNLTDYYNLSKKLTVRYYLNDFIAKEMHILTIKKFKNLTWTNEFPTVFYFEV